MARIEQLHEIIIAIKELKLLLIKVQDFDNAAILRDMEKQYLDKEL